jgi:hypothetical protein
LVAEIEDALLAWAVHVNKIADEVTVICEHQEVAAWALEDTHWLKAQEAMKHEAEEAMKCAVEEKAWHGVLQSVGCDTLLLLELGEEGGAKMVSVFFFCFVFFFVFFFFFFF